VKEAMLPETQQAQPSTPIHRHPRRVPVVIAAGVAAVLGLGLLMVARAGSRINKVALVAMPMGVTAVEARAINYSPQRKYVGTLMPWVEAKIGPQLISAYVGSVLVRPGDHVRRGQIVGTLDCRNASATSQAVAMQARAIQTQQEALAHEAARIAELQNGGFASDNEIEKKQADSASKQAELLSTRAKLERATLEVNDCVLRAPFDGEVSDRTMDPGAYIHPGQSIAAVVDRTTVRVGADVPEEDFGLVHPGVKVAIHALANGRDLVGRIARRSPAADESTRTVHFEVDIPDPERTLPVGTTAEIDVAAGAPIPATEIPLAAGEIKGTKATLFIVDHEVSRKVVIDVLGEKGGNLFVKPSLKAGALVITEGRALLKEGDRVHAKVDPIADNEQAVSPQSKANAKEGIE
jgi:RND family efflux transporter MFP subunit